METIAHIKGYLSRKCELVAQTDKQSKYRFVLILENGQQPTPKDTMAVACEIWAANEEYWPIMLRMGTWVSVMGNLQCLSTGNGIHNTGLAYMEAKSVSFI